MTLHLLLFAAYFAADVAFGTEKYFYKCNTPEYLPVSWLFYYPML
jgi:hypothetical protein